jgi:signal transduction histidine kinase
MRGEQKAREQLGGGLVEARRCVAELETLEAKCGQAKEALRESQAELFAIFDNAPIAMILVDQERRVRRANRTTAELINHPVEEMIGLRSGEALHCLYSLDDPQGCGFGTRCEKCTLRRVVLDTFDTGTSHFQVEDRFSITRNGTQEERDLFISTTPVNVSKSQMVLVYIEDVTEQKLTERVLRRRNSELAFLNQAGQTLNSTLELDQVLATVLGEVRRLMGAVACSIWLADLETGELVCRQTIGPQSEIVRGWRLAPGDGLAGWVAQSGKSLIVPDVRTDERHFDGVDRQTGLALRSILSVPLQVKNDVIGVLQVTDTEVDRFSPADLTLLESLVASAAIAIDNARLVEKLRQRNTELQARNEELDAFAHTVAHDLKGPLGPVVGYAETLAMDYASIIDKGGLHRLQKIAKNGRKMGRIIDELLVLAGVRKVGEVKMKPLDMAGIVAEAQERLAQMIEERQAEINLPDTWPVALGHSPWVEEVWTNYLSNGINYGGRPPRMELGATPQLDGMVRFWIRDNGSGLTLEEQDRLFTPFTRLDQVRAKGHGLGLSIVRRIVEKLGGEVGVESGVGRGSVFFFTLPGAGLE